MNRRKQYLVVVGRSGGFIISREIEEETNSCKTISFFARLCPTPGGSWKGTCSYILSIHAFFVPVCLPGWWALPREQVALWNDIFKWETVAYNQCQTINNVVWRKDKENECNSKVCQVLKRVGEVGVSTGTAACPVFMSINKWGMESDGFSMFWAWPLVVGERGGLWMYTWLKSTGKDLSSVQPHSECCCLIAWVRETAAGGWIPHSASLTGAGLSDPKGPVQLCSSKIKIHLEYSCLVGILLFSKSAYSFVFKLMFIYKQIERNMSSASAFLFRTGESSYRACFSFHSSYVEVCVSCIFF